MATKIIQLCKRNHINSITQSPIIRNNLRALASFQVNTGAGVGNVVEKLVNFRHPGGSEKRL